MEQRTELKSDELEDQRVQCPGGQGLRVPGRTGCSELSAQRSLSAIQSPAVLALPLYSVFSQPVGG